MKLAKKFQGQALSCHLVILRREVQQPCPHSPRQNSSDWLKTQNCPIVLFFLISQIILIMMHNTVLNEKKTLANPLDPNLEGKKGLGAKRTSLCLMAVAAMSSLSSLFLKSERVDSSRQIERFPPRKECKKL